MNVKKIKVDNNVLYGYTQKLHNKTLLFLTGSRGYIMCGYLNMETADKFEDVAIKVTGVSSIDEMLSARADEVSVCARKIGISKGQKIKDILPIIA